MYAKDKLKNAIKYCEEALEHLEQNELRKAVGECDYAKDGILAAIYLLIAEIKDQEGEF